jgi:hypothetical protein
MKILEFSVTWFHFKCAWMFVNDKLLCKLWILFKTHVVEPVYYKREHVRVRSRRQCFVFQVTELRFCENKGKQENGPSPLQIHAPL